MRYREGWTWAGLLSPEGKSLEGGRGIWGHMERGPWVLQHVLLILRDRGSAPLRCSVVDEERCGILGTDTDPDPAECLLITSSSGQFSLRVPRLRFSAFWSTSIQLPLFSWWMLSNLCTMTSSITHTVLLAQWLPSCHRKGFWLQRTRRWVFGNIQGRFTFLPVWSCECQGYVC